MDGQEAVESKHQEGVEEGHEEQDHEAGRESPFSVDMSISDMKEQRNAVNVHQFYPDLEHDFTKSSTIFALEQDQRTEAAIKEIIEDSTFTSIDRTATENSKLLNEDSQQPLMIEGVPEGSTLGPLRDQTDGKTQEIGAQKEDDNNSAKTDKYHFQMFFGPASVFSTAVSEETLDKARARGRSIFQTEEWGPVQKYSAGMQEIIDKKASEHFERAMMMKTEKNYAGTIIAINKAMGLRPDDPVYFIERAEAYIQLCDFKSAILNYKRACLLEPDNEQYYRRLAFLYYFQGQTLFDQRLYPEALECFSSAAEMSPNNVGYHIRSITCLAALQRHGECLALVNKRLETENDNPDLYIMRARLHEMFRNTTLCYYDVKDALALNENHLEARAMMAALERRARDNKMTAIQLNLMGKHREALQKVSIAIETNPAVADFHVLRGALHRKLGDFNSAIDDFLLALDKCDHDEDSPVYVDSQRQLLLTYNDFAVECFTKSFYDEAIILLNKAIKGEKREKGLYVNRGDCFFRQNDFNFALQDYTQALELDPNDDSIRSRMSVIYNEHGVTAYQDKNFPEAESKFTEAIKYNPKVGQYYISRARARYMMESMSAARQDLLMGLLLDPTNEDVISILSRLFPGKSVADVMNSRAAESAKQALKNILSPPKPRASRMSKSVAGGTFVESTFYEDDTLPPKSAAPTEWSQADTDVTKVDNALLIPEGTIPNFKSCMKEQEFNIKLVEEKKKVHDEIKSVLQARPTLKYAGPRMQPLPPPSLKPTYGGLRKERLIKSPGLTSKKKSTNWKQFSMGIGIGTGTD